jgi:low molecular weight phosphotyrosine protein phosphatase
MTSTPEVLFVCIHNAGRSQMAAALLDHQAADVVITMGCATPAPSTPASATSTGTCPTPPAFPWKKSAPSATKSPAASGSFSPNSPSH